MQDDLEGQNEFLVVQLGPKKRLKISYDAGKGCYHFQHQSKVSRKEWGDGRAEYVDPGYVVDYADRIISAALSQNKQRNKFRLGIAAVGSAFALYSCVGGKSKAAVPPQIPDQDQPVATQRYLEL